MIKKTLLSILALLIVFIGVLVINTLTFKSRQISVEKVDIPLPENTEQDLAKAVQFQTVSYEDNTRTDTTAFNDFHKFLAETYPFIDSLCELKMLDRSLIYKLQGKNADLKPVILMSHQDVVPVDENTRDQWEADPFAGEIKDGIIWGRGTMDDKVSLIAIMESMEYLLRNGYSPERTIYMAFGQDEEVGGVDGAQQEIKYFQAQNIQAEFVLDEGGYVAEGMVPGVSTPVAMINVAEKGYVSYKITVTTRGGHSSMPPRDNTIALLADAINKLEEHQFPYKLVEPLQSQLNYLGPELPFKQKLFIANKWLFGSFIAEGFNAHTTTAPTIIQGGVKANVIPTTAWVLVNFRILPGETQETVKKYIEDIIGDDRITIEADGFGSNPSPISDIDTKSFAMISKTIKQLLPDVIVTPGLLGGGTDATNFYPITNNVYRFFPIRVSEKNMTGFHGLNESIPVDNFHEIVQFYIQLIRNCNEL